MVRSESQKIGGTSDLVIYDHLCDEHVRKGDIMFEDMGFGAIGISLNVGIMMLVSLMYYIRRLSREGKD